MAKCASATRFCDADAEPSARYCYGCCRADRTQAAKSSIPSITASKRMEWNMSKVCCAPRSSANTTGAGAVRSSAATNARRAFHRHHRVVVAVRDEERRPARARVVERRRPPIRARVERPVVAVQRDGRGNRRVGLLEARLERGIVGCERGQGREMAPCRAAAHEHHHRVAAVVGSVRAHPRDGPFGIHELVRKCRPPTEAVVRAHTHPPVTRQPSEERTRPRLLWPPS